MLQIFKTIDNKLQELSLDELATGCWLNLTNPTSEEINTLINKLNININLSYFYDSLDLKERPRIEAENDSVFIVIGVPIIENSNNFLVIPLGIILTVDYIITVSAFENEVINSIIKSSEKGFDTSKKNKLLFSILFKNTQLYLEYLEIIDDRSEEIQVKLKKTMQNKSLFGLFEVQKSLVFFTTALRNNGAVLDKLSRLKENLSIQDIFNFQKEDIAVIKDIIIDNNQALYIVEMHINILESMMDAFASIISNNLNVVMRFLTSVTIVLTVPSVIAGLWGMNVKVPFAHHPFAFYYILLISFSITAVIAYNLWKREMF